MAHVLLRILCLAGCALGLAFVVTLLTSLPSETAHAESRAAESRAADSRAADEATSAPALWADPGTLSATANRRAIGDAPRPVPRLSAPAAVPERPSAPSRPTPADQAREGLATPTTPMGSMGAGGGAPDIGPSMAQLAVLAAALLGVRWLSQRVRARELSWRNTLITLSIERPG